MTRALVAAILVVATLVAGALIFGAASEEPAALGPGPVTVELGIHHSRFSWDRIDVRPGTTVRFVVTNDDPIPHELIAGGDVVHDRHAAGTEVEHGTVPGEVSLPPGATGVTELAFDRPGTFRFACHLPGHLAYGMSGEVVVG